MTVRHAAPDPTNKPYRQTSAYVAILKEQIEIRRREYGYSWVTPQEHAWLAANGLLPRDVMIAPAGTISRRPDDVSGPFSAN